ncbi:tyrosine-type recombinase/integrase [bacterium]|nr:tyrosine-type recombinase/integrase [bacterium]
MKTDLILPNNYINLAYTLVRAFFQGKSEATLKAYKADLEAFREFTGAKNLSESAKKLIELPLGEANLLALNYKTEMQKRRLRPTTINRRLSAIRSLVRLANTLGMVNWQLEVKNDQIEAYRDTSGPGENSFQKMLTVCQNQKNKKKAVRDYVILRLLHDLALRRGSIVNLNIEDLELNKRLIWVSLKKRTEKVQKYLPEVTLRAIENWIAIRGDQPGPLFINLDRANNGSRLTGTSIYRMVRSIGEQIGVKTRPHGIRHTAITEAVKRAQENGIGIEEVMQFSDHKDIKTLLIYRDRERNTQGLLSRLIVDES